MIITLTIFGILLYAFALTIRINFIPQFLDNSMIELCKFAFSVLPVIGSIYAIYYFIETFVLFGDYSESGQDLLSQYKNLLKSFIDSIKEYIVEKTRSKHEDSK